LGLRWQEKEMTTLLFSAEGIADMRTSAFGACLLMHIPKSEPRIVFIEQACSGIFPHNQLLIKQDVVVCDQRRGSHKP
jgi:hypothetical protein